MINHLFGVVLGDFELAFASDPVLGVLGPLRALIVDYLLAAYAYACIYAALA